MSKTIAATAGLAVLLATAAPAQAQSSAPTRAKSTAAKRLVLQVKKAGGTSVKARCRAPKRGSSLCSVTYRASEGRRCADTRVTVVRKNGRMKVKGFSPACTVAKTPGTTQQPAAQPAPQPAPQNGSDVPVTPTTMPGPGNATLPAGSSLLDPGAFVPGGPPPGGASASERPPGAPKTAPRTAIARASSQNHSFIGCTEWQVDPWYGSWWMYVCYWSYSSAPAGAHLIGWQTSYVAQVYYWTGSQAAFWFRSEWTA